MERLRLATTLPADPTSIYDAWLSAKRHALMTGANATSEAKKGGAFTAWDGYISGTHLVLERGKRIVQAWRTTEFPSSAPDSTLEIRLSKVTKGTKMALLQSDIPDGQSEMYAEGWLEYYFDPMTRYFAAEHKDALKKARPKKAAKKKKAGKKSKKKSASPAKAAPRAARKTSKKPGKKVGKKKAAGKKKAGKKKAKKR